MNIIENYLRETSKTKYRLSKDSGIPYSTVSDICSGKTPLNRCSAETIYRLSEATGISCDEIIGSACGRDIRKQDGPDEARKKMVVITDAGAGNTIVNADIYARNGEYFADFNYRGEKHTVRLCHVCEDADRYLNKIAEWGVGDAVSQIDIDRLAKEIRRCGYAIQ